MTTRMWWLALAVPLLIAGLGYGALRYMTAVPGTPHKGALPPLTAEETALAAALARHIGVIAAHEHNVAHYDELETVARYLETTLESLGYSVGRQVFTADGKPVRNIDVTIEPPAGRSNPEVVVVGAHYDSARGTPGANDNATGAAAVLELARLMRDLRGVSGKRIRLVLFVNEEPPYFMTEAMGSLNYARALAARHERVVAMYSLETIGFYSSAPGSQSYPAPFGLMSPIAATSSPSSGCWDRARCCGRRCGRSARIPRSRPSAGWRPARCPASAGRIMRRSPSTAFRR